MVKFSRKYRNKNLRHKSKKQIGGSLKNALFRVIDKIHYDYSLNPKWAKDHLLKALISPPVNINARNSNGYTPLSLAIRYLDENLTKILLEHNANPNVYYIELENFENHNITLLHRISNDERHISTTNVEDSSDDEESLQSLEKQKTIMRLLLKHGANVNSITSTYFDTPLHMAVKKNNHELIKILLDKGANTELKNNNNHSPLDVAKIKVNNNSPHSVEGIKSRKTVKLLEAHEAKRRRSDLYTQYVGRSSNPRLNTDTINKIKPFYGGNDAQDVQGASLEIFDKIISDYKNKTGMRGAEYEGHMQRLLATDGSRGVHRPRLEQLAHEQAIVQNAAQGRGRPMTFAEAEAIAAQVVAARHRPAQRRPQLQDVAELASRAGQAAQARARRAWSRGRIVSHMTEVRFALRIMNMLRQEFMKCHYSPNPGQGYLDAKENFESLTFEGQAGGQKFRPKKLKYKPYYGGNDAQDAQAAANLALKADADNAIKEARTAALFKAVITSETPFENYNEQLAKELLDTGIDPNSRNENQVTLLGFAVDRLKTNMVKILLEYNADPNLNCTPGPNDSGPSLPPLHMLTMNLTHLEPYDPNNNAVHALFENEAHWTQMVKNQNIQAQKDILVLLLKNGANINKLNSDNDAPIHLAIETENKHLLQKLLDNGANPDILNFNGKSPLILASDSLHESDLAVATLLVENNPIPPSLMERGANALDMVNILRIHLAKRERNKVLTTQLAPPTNKDIIPTNELPKGKRIITKSNDYPLISDVIGNINSYYGGNSQKNKKPYYYRKSKKNKKLVTKKQKDIVGGAGAKRIHTHTPNFLIKLHKMLSQPEHYSNIISWTKNEKGKIVIIIKNKMEVLKEICPASTGTAFSACTRQFTNYSFLQPNRAFETYTRRRDAPPLSEAERKAHRREQPRDQTSHTYYHHSELENIDDILNIKARVRTRSGMYLDNQKKRNTKEIDDRDRDIANVLMQLNNQSPQSTDMDNNETANVLASIANISDENTEDLDRRNAYLQNLNTNNDHSLKIALLIESLKNHVIDENEKNQIKQKQNELWQGLKEIPMEDEQRRGVLYKYMFEYLKRTIPQAKLNEGAEIAKSIFESIKRAQIHNRHTKPLTESEQKQADEEMNAAISRESQLGQNEDTIMEDVQSPNISDWVEVYWAGEGEWYLGRLVGMRRQSGRSELKVAYADGDTIYESLHDVPFDGDGDPPNVADGEPRHWRWAEVPAVRKVVIDVDGLVERDIPIRWTGKPRAQSRYESATTAREYMSLGGSLADLKYDLVNGFFVEDAPVNAHASLPSSSVVIIRDSRVLGRQVPASPLSSLAPNTQLEPSSAPAPAPQPEAPTEAPKPKRWKLGVVPPPGTRVSVRMPASTLSRGRDRTQVQHHEGTVGDAEAPTAAARTLLGRALAMVKFDDGSERPIDFAVPGISITREASQSGGVIYVDDENDKMRFECPISTEIMNEPVIAEDGYSYEKEEIVNWIKLSEDKGNPITSPITGDNMGKTLIPNTVLKDIIKNSVFDRQHTNQESSQIQDENKNKGIVIQYKNSKYGFIHTFDGIDNLFFHSSQLDNQIIVGDIVSFVIKEFKGKPTATNIKLIEPAWNRKTGVIVKYNNDKQYGFIEPNINGMPHIFVHVSEINQRVSVGDKVSFIIGNNMAGKAVAKKVKIINDKIDDEIGVEEEKKEDSEIPQLEQRLLMELIFERDRIMREREKVNSGIKSRK